MRIVRDLEHTIGKTSAVILQDVWTHTSDEGLHPFVLVDTLGEAAKDMVCVLSKDLWKTSSAFERIVANCQSDRGTQKLLKYYLEILSGIIVGSFSNICFESEMFSSNQAKSRSMPRD